jgi:GPH family glycoside/pentoside/hexuronide:cation symporter
MVGKLSIDPIILIDPILCGPMWVAVKILLASMMADICDEDELRHGKRREGMFGAVFSWVEKMAISLSFLGTGLALACSGFNEALGGAQTARTFTTMRLFLAGAPAITALFALVALAFYPIDAKRAAKTRKVLEDRRGAVTG